MGFNATQFFEYGRKRGNAPNTFIGGIGSVTNTKELLAFKLEKAPSGGSMVNNIKSFSVIDGNISCYIDTDYQLTTYASWSGLTSYVDLGNRLKRLPKPMGPIPLCTLLYFPAVTYIGGWGGNYDQFTGAQGVFYIPNCTSLGDTALNDNVFRYGNAKFSAIYVHPSLATNNAGLPDGDMNNINATVVKRYVTNFTAPNPITNLSIGNVYASALQLNFTAPTGNTNAIDFYECYANGVYKNTITASGEYITGLTPNTPYTIELKPVDIFYNKSTSNTVTQVTAATLVYLDSLVSYYKMEGNVLDSWGTNDGTATAITYTSGLVGQGAVFNGTSSVVIIPDADNLSFGNGVTDSPFSISFVTKLNDTTSHWFAEKRTDFGATAEYEFRYYLGKLEFVLYDGIANAYILISYAWTPVIGTVYKIQGTYDGTRVKEGLKLYINNVSVGSYVTSGAYVAMRNTTARLGIGKAHWGVDHIVNGSIDEFAIFNKALTGAELSDINTKLQSGQSLI